MACNIFNCTIKFGLIELSKIPLFKDLIGNIIEAKVAENGVLHFSVTLTSIIFKIKSLNKVIFDDSNRPNRIVKMNGLYL